MSAVVAMLYVGAMVKDKGELDLENVWARPGTVRWMSDMAIEYSDDEHRLARAAAPVKTEQKLIALPATGALTNALIRSKLSRDPAR